jgi:catecholate siderophore receptor
MLMQISCVFQRALLSSLLWIGFAASASGQQAVTIRGRVFDPMQAPIAGARISAEGSGKQAVATFSSPSGEFLLRLPPGPFTLHVSADGFSDVLRELDATSASTLIEVAMQVQALRTELTVTESAGYQVAATTTATKTATPLLDIPQSITVVNRELIRDQMMMNLGDVVRYVPGITMAQGEGHRDAPVIRGNSTTSDFYVNGVRDDVQYMRDLYNLERVEAVKGPNAMIFGRGGGGGVINRVTKEAVFTPLREIVLQGGMFGHKRVSGDVNQAIGEKVALRLNAMYEDSASFRNYFELQRYGMAPTVTFAPDERTRIRIAYEYFRDQRTTDRGVPSFAGRPATPNRSTFFGNPDESRSAADVHLGSAVFERQFASSLHLRNSTLFGAYDKFYSNVLPGTVNAARTLVQLTGYQNSTLRKNVFNQTDATYTLATGSIRHTLLTGAEFGRQATGNFRDTAYFGNTATSVNVPFGAPTDFTPVTWRQNATDADNRPVNTVGAVYVQDQVHVSRLVQLVAGVRYDRFAMDFLNRRTNSRLARTDHMVSPRAGIVLKPRAELSAYFNYSVAYLPSSGDQFSSLDATTQTLKPERFTNYEGGLKWDVRRSLSFTAAIYRLDRTNTRATDPNRPGVIVQTGSQRTNGFEAGVNGNVTSRWTIAGGYANQEAFISSATAAARLGAVVPMVPRHTLSMWNHYRLTTRLSAGLGLIHQADMWAGIDNAVTIPRFTRADAAVYYSLTEKIRVQANAENITNRSYYVNAHSNNNITPGAPLVLRVATVVRF